MKPVEKTSEYNSKTVYLNKNLYIVFSISLIAVLGVVSITPAFPKLAQVLNVSPQNVGLLITVFTLPTVILGPILGVLADRFGRKKILVPSLILFGIAGTACTFVSEFNLLLVLRFIQGIGAASLLSLSITLIGDFYSGQKRTTAMGYTASVSSIGTATYPTIGGALAVWGWNYPFLLPLLAIPVGLLVLFFLDSPQPQSKQNFQEYLKSALQSLKNRQLVGLFVSTAATFTLLYGAYLAYIPFLLQNSLNADTFTIGLVLSSTSATITFTSLQLGRLARLFSETILIQASFFLYGLALAIIPFVNHVWMLLIPAIIFGIALGIGTPSIQSLLVSLAPKEYRAAVVSLNGTVLGLGQTLGPLLMGAAFSIWEINGVFYLGLSLAIATLIFFRHCTCL
jgi:ACDE family multidrug resistance protein